MGFFLTVARDTRWPKRSRMLPMPYRIMVGRCGHREPLCTRAALAQWALRWQYDAGNAHLEGQPPRDDGDILGQAHGPEHLRAEHPRVAHLHPLRAARRAGGVAGRGNSEEIQSLILRDFPTVLEARTAASGHRGSM